MSKVIVTQLCKTEDKKVARGFPHQETWPVRFERPNMVYRAILYPHYARSAPVITFNICSALGEENHVARKCLI